ncbi:hypothetical protein SAMN05892877_12352 [Rhizobium subbaraonis]|uniref:Uncharacterized protein n=1 Tax=Rhizobium subbaraonis TaxID=908946 RepID=A0A285V0S1_9HYPH|nr:hypothetical protein [Rhizobium subbaraonis]SOC46606.1 hypothetical protein SAMN05892877_12352 [Rhizobium subbaraonis]
MAARPLPSEHLDALVRELSPHCGGDEVSFPGADFDKLVERLATIRKMVAVTEREVGALRLAEVARSGRVIVENLATEHLQHMAEDADGKIVRPDFGRKG